MADNVKSQPNPEQSFEEYLRSAPATEAQDTVTLIGVVTRSEKEGNFYLSTGGQTVELPSSAVRQFRVVQENAPQKLVELDVDPAQLPQQAGLAQRITNPQIDTIFTKKELIKDPIYDTRKEVTKDPIFDTRKEVTKDPVFDTFKEVVKDPLTDPLTLVGEQVDPSPIGGDPAAGLGGLTPFVLATPHHASAAAVGLQAGAAAQKSVAVEGANPYLGGIGTQVAADVHHTTHWFDQLITRKEIAKDPIFDQQVVSQISEQIDPGFGNVVNPVAGLGVTPQGLQTTAALHKNIAQEAVHPGLQTPLTIATSDVHTLYGYDHPVTLKEMTKDPIKDTHKDPIIDPLQQVPVWGLPGLMF